MAEPAEFDRLVTCVAACLREGRTAHALCLAERTVVDFPRNPASWHQLALALSALGRSADAETAVRSGLTYDPAHAPLWLTFADLARLDRRLELARHCYHRASALDPTAPIPWAGAAAVLHELGRGRPALRACRKARALGHPDPGELLQLERRITASLPRPPRARIPLRWPAAIVVATALGGAALPHPATHVPTGYAAAATGRTVAPQPAASPATPPRTAHVSSGAAATDPNHGGPVASPAALPDLVADLALVWDARRSGATDVPVALRR